MHKMRKKDLPFPILCVLCVLCGESFSVFRVYFAFCNLPFAFLLIAICHLPFAILLINKLSSLPA